MTRTRAYLQRLATAHGAFAHAQADLAEAFRASLDQLEGGQRVAQMVGFVSEHSAIRTRYIEIPDAALDDRRDWYRLVNEANEAMATRVLRGLFQDGAEAARCDGFIVVSSSYSGFPSLSRRLVEPLGLPLDALCFDLAGLGCAGPTQALALAHGLLEQGRCRSVCMLCVDAMGTFARCRRHRRAPTMSQVVAHALASDGAAALIVSRDPGDQPLLCFERSRVDSRLWPGSLDQNDLTADEYNEPLLSVGKDIRTRIGVEIDRVLDGEALGEPLLLHPGGAALMRLLAERHPQLGPTVDLSMSVLAGHGNLGASSLLWVLQAALRNKVRLSPRLRLLALGPGIVTTCLRLDGVKREDES